MSNAAAPAPRFPFGVFGVDVLAVAIFAAIGYTTHSETGYSLQGSAITAGPFIIALVAMHFALLRLDRDPRDVVSGLIVWVGTVAGGMLVRIATGEGTALAFVIVATLFNLATLVGWRALAAFVRSRRPATE